MDELVNRDEDLSKLKLVLVSYMSVEARIRFGGKRLLVESRSLGNVS